MKSVSTALVLAGILLLCGCGAPEGPPALGSIPLPTPNPGTGEQLTTIADDAQTERLERFTSLYPDAEAPVTARERFVSSLGWGPAVADCLTAQGFEAVGSADGGYMTMAQGDDSTERAQETARYVCESQFPLDPAASLPLSGSQVTYLYRYQTEILKPCLERAGYKVDKPPTLATYPKRYPKTGGGWDPYRLVQAGNLWDSLQHQCPQVPEHLWG